MRRWLLTIAVALLGTVNSVFAEDWKGTHANDGLVKEFMKQGLSESAAKTKAKETADKVKKSVEKGHPGDFVSCTVEQRCYVKDHARRNFHGKPNGPLDCD
jgi:hypothetical protein